MNFVKFPVNATNIFPIANTTKGGQYVTEFNLRALDSVATDERVQYMIGPSYVHSAVDFEVKCQPSGVSFFEDQTTSGSSTVLTIMPGRGIINGHFVELLAPITIDLAEAHAEATLRNEVFDGTLVVGLRAMYATERTIAGALLPEEVINPDTYPNPEDHPSAMYEGIQVVILPVEEFVLPTDEVAWSDKSQVTAHIKLAEFSYSNGVVKGLVNNYPQKCISIPANRVGTVGGNAAEESGAVSSEFISKKGLNPKKLYTYGGWNTRKNAAGEQVLADTWCDSTDSLMIWDSNPKLVTQDPFAIYPEATFTGLDDGVQLILPHKQPDIANNPFMKNQDGAPQRYQTKVMQLPVADFDTGTPGVVNKQYTQNVKEITDRIKEFYAWVDGVQRGYIETLDLDEATQKRQLPEINPAWNIGDYIIVGTDNTVAATTETETTWIRNPSTMYMIVPGVVREVGTMTPQRPSGMEIGYIEVSGEEMTELGFNTTDMASLHIKDSDDVQKINKLFDLSQETYKGYSRTTEFINDYFTVVSSDGAGGQVTYYYPVAIALKEYTEPPIMLTGQIPLASTEQIGGFISVDESAVGHGYVRLDEYGNLVLVDYGLLSTGVLAYQLGEDFDCPAGFSYEEMQSWLDEYINQRVAFPNAKHLQNSKHPNIIYINLTLSKSDSEVTLNIGDIDSRFGTSICLNIYGDADSNTIINISNCEKIRVGYVATSETGAGPQINLYRCNLYYDAGIIDWATNIENLQLWYEKYAVHDENVNSLPDLLVDGLTVTEIGIPQTSQDVGYWTDDTPNDNHFSYALKSITLDSYGRLAGCSVLIKNDTTSNVELGKAIISGKCDFPRGNGLLIPTTKAVSPVKITGEFISAYSSTDSSNTRRMLMQDVKFTMLTPYFDKGEAAVVSGKIHFLSDVFYITKSEGLNPDTETSLDGWDQGTYHIFHGCALS